LQNGLLEDTFLVIKHVVGFLVGDLLNLSEKMGQIMNRLEVLVYTSEMFSSSIFIVFD